MCRFIISPTASALRATGAGIARASTAHAATSHTSPPIPRPVGGGCSGCKL